MLDLVIVRRRRGSVLVEVLVTLTVGLWLLGSVATLLVQQVVAQRQILARVRLAQDVDAATGVIVRELRRARYWSGTDGTNSTTNPHAPIWPGADDEASTSVGFSYSDNAGDEAGVMTDERLGFRLNPEHGTIDMRLAGSALAPADGDVWQPLTDPQSVRIAAFSVSHRTLRRSLLPYCARTACAAGDATCPPLLEHTSFEIRITAADPHDPTITLDSTGEAIVRNDAFSGRCPS